MPDYQYIPVRKDLIPYVFDITLSGRTFAFYIRYNAMRDFFTVDLLSGDKYIVIGEKIVYGRVLFLNQQHLDVPTVPIIPYDLSLRETRVSWGNLGDTVFLWLPAGGLGIE